MPHFHKASYFPYFLSYYLHSCTSSNLLRFLAVILFSLLTSLLRACNISCYFSYCINYCIVSRLLCFLSAILFHSSPHFIKACKMLVFYFCIIALFKTRIVSFQIFCFVSYPNYFNLAILLVILFTAWIPAIPHTYPVPFHWLCFIFA